MILTSQDQLKNLDNVGAVLIYPSRITTSELIQSATSNDLVINCIVDDDPDNAFIGQSLSQLGYPSGCYIVINYQNKKTAEEIKNTFSSNLQLGYRAAIIVNKSDYTQDDFKVFSQYGIIVIDHNDVENYVLTVPEFITSRSLAMIRDYTNVDIDDVGPGAYVGIGKDTSGLGGGRSFGYSTNGQDFYAVITPKGLVFRQIDALRMWRLLKPQQDAQIDDFFNNKVAKEIEAQNESLESAVATANSAVNAANQAVNDSKANSDAIKDKADQSQITQLTNIVQSKVSSKDYQTAISQLTNDINAKVAKGDLISQINIEAGQTLIQSKKLFLDADSVVFSGKAFIPDAAIANLSLDKLTTGHLTVPIADEYGNQIEMGNSGIDLISASEPINYSSNYAPSEGPSNDKSTFRLNLSSSGISFTDRIEYGDTSPQNNKVEDYQFVNLQPDILHEPDGSSDIMTIPSGMTMYVPVNYSSGLGPNTPGGFFALGHEITNAYNVTDRGIDIAYVTKEINGWEMGLHVRTPMHILPPGADHGIRTAWVSWSNWDNGEKYPALVQEGPNWGGIVFPKSGRVTLFDANGRYYTPDRNTGIGPYNNYGGS